MPLYKSDLTFLRVEQQRHRENPFPFDAWFKVEGIDNCIVAVPVERPDVFKEGAVYVLSIDLESP
jgi:hypothetical protein